MTDNEGCYYTKVGWCKCTHFVYFAILTLMSLISTELRVYNQVLQRITKKQLRRKKVLAILVGGSYARNELQKGSDIDILVISDIKDQTHYESHSVVDDISVEVIEIPLVHARQQFKIDKNKRRRFLSGVIAGGKYVAGNKKLADALVKQASTSLNASVPIFNKKELADLLFFLGQSPEKELLLQMKDKPLAAQLRMNHKLATCLEVAFCLENKVVPHHKHWDAELKTFKDKKMARLLRQATLEEDVFKKQQAWSMLVQYVVKTLQ